MNGLVIVLIAIVVLGAGYLLYGRWLANKWGLDPKAKTPAYTHEDGQDYVPSSKLTVFAHQFSSIAGAGHRALQLEENLWVNTVSLEERKRNTVIFHAFEPEFLPSDPAPICWQASVRITDSRHQVPQLQLIR